LKYFTFPDFLPYFIFENKKPCRRVSLALKGTFFNINLAIQSLKVLKTTEQNMSYITQEGNGVRKVPKEC